MRFKGFRFKPRGTAGAQVFLEASSRNSPVWSEI